MAKLEGEAVRFQGKLYEDWPSLQKALVAAGIKPTEWVRNNQNKALALDVRLGPDGKSVVKAFEFGGETGLTRSEFDEAKTEAFFADTKQDLRDIGITDEALINDVITQGVDTEDINSVLTALARDPRLENFLPGFNDLVQSGMLDMANPVGAFAGYKDLRRGVNELYNRFFGRDAIDAEFKGFTEGGLSLEFSANFFQFRQDFINAFEQFQGRAPTDAEIQAAFGSGQTIGRITQGFQAQAITAARSPEIQRAAQTTGQRFTARELQAFGEAEAGLENELGLEIQARVDEVFRRVNRIFQGQVARGSLALPSRRRRESVDVGA